LTERGCFAATAYSPEIATSSSFAIEDKMFPPCRREGGDFKNSTIEPDMSMKTKDRCGKPANGMAIRHGRIWAVDGVGFALLPTLGLAGTGWCRGSTNSSKFNVQCWNAYENKAGLCETCE
jgi:hypothetical protein